ncbi:hypothetical protein KGA66_25625 [Actinocrinis puniceicyclus]|uniref:Uncharacterized protein n=1 Tax=Actinocrinis puniceicyclus TaxID=977794 RepID=A0A8J7WU00_9ACTN|nr:hypothetical protein [Actinocrinis puniceicyclus]MBS2966447.1 hypothetical protein [Actinocrinis puniceicyclus]
MHSILHVALVVGADSGIETRTNDVLGPTLILGDHPRTVDIALPTRPELATAFLTRLAETCTTLAARLAEPSEATRA